MCPGYKLHEQPEDGVEAEQTGGYKQLQGGRLLLTDGVGRLETRQPQIVPDNHRSTQGGDEGRGKTHVDELPDGDAVLVDPVDTVGVEKEAGQRKDKDRIVQEGVADDLEEELHLQLDQSFRLRLAFLRRGSPAHYEEQQQHQALKNLIHLN